MTDSVKETFNISPGFSVEEINGQLYYEDLEEDDELWLIRMPCDIELSALDRQKILLCSNDEGISSKNLETENGRTLECYTKTSEISDTCIVLPKRQDGQLHAVKKVFKGAILISESLALNNEIEIKSEKEDCFYDPNSCSIIPSNNEKVINKKGKSYSNLSINDPGEKSENVTVQYENASRKRKSSKKKKHLQTDFDSSDLNYETEAAESTYFSKSPKKLPKDYSHSSRNSSERKKVKSELMSTD